MLRKWNFDTLGNAMITLFSSSTGEGWPEYEVIFRHRDFLVIIFLVLAVKYFSVHSTHLVASRNLIFIKCSYFAKKFM